ncbi:MAG: hypothetical protein SXA11_05500 [Cyanobacteriota bacterium]|nr:hypothetical protein [Cyanobacteriota bacterium]
MNTPSHAIINLAVLGKSKLPQLNLAIVMGGFLPDIPIFAFYFWAKFIARMPEGKIWSEAYYQPFMQNVVAISHSIPLALIGWAIAYYFKSELMQVIFLSMVLHCLLDLPVHHDDAHRHFFPLSNYRFISPISYWDPKHYGAIVAFVEMTMVLLGTFRVFPWVSSTVGQVLMVGVNVVYLVGYFLFYAR